jgi:hypothetical protein
MTYQHGDPVEVKGVISDLNPRVWARGWTTGKLRALATRTEYKITGILEGYITGTRVTVRGTWKEDPKYGGGIAVDAVLVDELTGDAVVVEAWFAKKLPDHFPVSYRVTAVVPIERRWEVLRSADELTALGIERDDAEKVAMEVDIYLRNLEAMKHIMAKGFTEQEANRILSEYRTQAELVLDADIYTLVHDEVVPFHRVDLIAQEQYSVERTAVPRICAGVAAALIEAARNGHTGLGVHEACVEGAKHAGLYPDIVQEVLPECMQHFKIYGDLVQLRRLANDEVSIARALHVLARRNKEE